MPNGNSGWQMGDGRWQMADIRFRFHFPQILRGTRDAAKNFFLIEDATKNKILQKRNHLTPEALKTVEKNIPSFYPGGVTEIAGYISFPRIVSEVRGRHLRKTFYIEYPLERIVAFSNAERIIEGKEKNRTLYFIIGAH